MSNKLTTELFIERARKVHGDRYDYSKVEYVDAKTKVCINCPKHGEFWQEASSHTSGCGCPGCSGKQRMDTTGFIERAKLVHKEKYSYDKTNYINNSTKLCITCPIHGDFWQAPQGHLNGKGCKECGKLSRISKRTTTVESFIERSVEIHNKKYDYSKVNYVNSKTKVCIMCPTHGQFMQTPAIHLKGCGCPKCAGYGKIIEDFITAAKEVHGEKYDYSKVIYVNTEHKVLISCPIHGDFLQSPYSHIHGNGCPKCAGIGLEKTELIAKARKVHGNKYDYSKMEYIDAMTNVCIICPTHGSFWQRFGHHIHGAGCPICGNDLMKEKSEYRRIGQDAFIQQAREVHGTKYNYQFVNYKNIRSKVRIICPKHGEFSQTPDKHIRGAGCPKCVGFGRTTKDFIREAIEVHGEKYDYSKTIYKDIKSKVCVICSKHGAFEQIADLHLNGAGCPKCASSKLQQVVRNYLEQRNINYKEEYKFEWLKDKGALRVDFYLPDNKIVIECQGIQHFEPVGYFGGEESYNENLKRDSLKRYLCEEHGLKVLYYSNLGINYPYTVYESLDDLGKELS